MSENDFYDIVLDLQSLSNLKEGFKIYYSEKGKKKINECKYESGAVITAIGNSNQGKSYILSKISDFNIPSGYHVNTHGLSIYFPDNLTKEANRRYVIIDTVGLQNEIKIDEMKKLTNIEKYIRIKEIFEDRQMTEYFLQNFAMESSHIVIAVIGQFTLQEQKFLNRIKVINKEEKLFIIHNLMFLESREQVEDYIKDTIEASLFFKLEKQSMINFGKREKDKKDDEIRYFYVEEIDDEKKNYIIHLIMAREGTEAGNYYNKTTIDYLRDNIIAFTKQSKL